MTRLRIAPTVPAISSVCGMKRIDTFGRVALVDYILIHEKLRFSEIGLRRDTRIDFAPIPCCGRKGGIDSLLARINSLLVCVGNLLANYWIRRCFRDGFSQKPADSAKFPAFFPATRESGAPGDRESDCARKAKSSPAVEGGNRVRAAREAADFSFQLIPDGKTAAARSASGNLTFASHVRSDSCASRARWPACRPAADNSPRARRP